jgi:uncharacterized membrane protein (DUF106 family)
MVVELIQTYPRGSIIGISVLVSLFISLINFFVLDKEKVRHGKKRQKELNKELKSHKDNPEKMMAIQKEMMSHTMDTLKHSFKPMLITLIPILVVFSWIKGAYAETSIASSWLWYYIISAIVASLVFRKLFKLP